MMKVSNASPNSGVPGRNVRPWSEADHAHVEEVVLRGREGFSFSVFLQAGRSCRISVSFKISKYSWTVVRATWASLATFVKFTIVAVAERGDLQKPAESGHVARRALSDDLLLEIETGIRPEVGAGSSEK